MNKELLFSLYAIHSESGNEKKMRRFVRKYISENCGDVVMDTDAYGNLLCVKGKADTYPCLAAHLDQVQRSHSKDFRAVEIEGDVIGWSPKCHEQQGLGADDKNGIFICLELLKRFDVMKVAFFVGEEVGCTGSSDVDLKFFKDCRFIIEPDRRGSSDLITSMFCGSVCSEDFIKAIGADAYGYKEDVGSITDVGTLVERGVGISCLNLSCGYYHAHTDEEITVLPELENCLNFVEHIVETCTATYPFEGGYGGYGYGYGRHGRCYGGWYDDWYGKQKKSSAWIGGTGKSSSIQTAQKSPCRTVEVSAADDDYDYYFGGGYYDMDYQMMEEYLQIQPDLTFQQIESSYLSDFNASWFFSHYAAVEQIRDIYDSVTDLQYEHSDFWGDDDNTPALEPCLPFKEVELKKVS